MIRWLPGLVTFALLTGAPLGAFAATAKPDPALGPTAWDPNSIGANLDRAAAEAGIAPSPGARRFTLGAAVQATLAASPSLRQAQLDVQRAEVGLASARGQRLTYSADLMVADGYGANGLFTTAGVTAGQLPTANAQLAARLPLFTGRRIERGIDQANAGIDAGRAQLEQVTQAAVWDVTQAYWMARRAELKEAIANEAVAKASLSRSIVRESRTIGRAGEGEVDRAEVALLNEQGDLLKAADDRLIARDQLSALVQQDLHDASFEDPPTPGNAAAPSFESSLQLALTHRPDVRVATARIVAAAADLDIANADHWPQLALEGAYQHGNNPYDPAAQARVVQDHLSGDAYARLDLTYHLFDEGSIARNIRGKDLLVAQADQGLLAVKRNAELEVREALARLAGARRRVTLGARSVTLANRNLAYMQNRYRFGYALLTELDEARQTLVSSESQRADAAIDLALANADLARATGTLAAPTVVGLPHP